MEEYEANYDWKKSILLFQSVSKMLSKKDRLDLTLRVMFLITYWFLEGNYTAYEEQSGVNELKKIYSNSLSEFRDEPDYLFCLSVITRLNECYFGIDIEEPTKFLMKAINIAPDVLLYKNWLDIRINQKRKSLEIPIPLSIQQWKEEKGLLGKYIVDYLYNIH